MGARPGERNEPAYLVTAIRAIAEIKDLNVETVVSQISRNTAKLYGIKQETT